MKNDDPDLEANVDPANENKLVRVIKSIVVNEKAGTYVDQNIIKFQYYNAFNYSLLDRGADALHLTLGVTSARPGQGKTLVASNLAVSLAMGSQKKTVLVDLNFLNPRLHEIFGINSAPGLSEAFQNGKIHVSRTLIDRLYVLPVGNFLTSQEGVIQSESFSDLASRELARPMIGLSQLPAFRDIIYSLEQEFEFVIVDMPSINSQGIPVLFANQLNGLIVVVDSGKTKREELDEMFQHINDRQVLGFVFNRVRERLK